MLFSIFLSLLRINDSVHDDMISKRISVYKSLQNPLGLHKHIFKFFGSDILSLWQFKNVFCSVNNRERQIWIDSSHIPAANPSSFNNSFCCFLWVFKIAFHIGWTPETNFSFRGSVGCEVVHFRNVSKSDLYICYWTTNMSALCFVVEGRKATSACFSHSIALP